MYIVLSPFHDKYHPEDIFYPGELVAINDKERASTLLMSGLIKEYKIKVLKSPKEDPEPESEPEETNPYSKIPVQELKEECEKRNIEYDKKAKKQELIDLLLQAD